MASTISEMSNNEASPAGIVEFWRQAGPDRWFEKDDDFDKMLTKRYLDLRRQAADGELDGWTEDANGSLALILLLDQFSRNMFRGSAEAFVADPKARTIADLAIRNGHDKAFDTDMRCFFYLPYEHSESLADQNRCVALVHQLGDPEYLKYAILHRLVIRRFARFPHRNAALGRHTSPAEEAYLASGGFSG